MDKPYRVAIYLRQSRDRDGNELAVSRQREDCLALCAERGWTPVEYLDNNLSASSRSVSRPRYREMLADVKSGLVQGIVAWDLDRLYRQPRELEDLIDLADEHGLALATVTGDVDLSTDNGRLYARIKGAVAKSEGERKAARWKRSNEQGAAAGRWTPTYRPFGYSWEGEPLEPEASAVREAYAAVLNGKSLRRVALDWNAAGLHTPDRLAKDGTLKQAGVPWSNRQVRKLLLNPKYKAKRVLRGEVVATGTWTALVDDTTFDGVEAILADPTRTVCTTFEIAHMGASVYRCGKPGCTSAMRTHYDGRGVRTYACKRQAHLVRRGDTLDDYVANAVLERLAAAGLTLVKRQRIDIKKLRTERETLEQRRDGLSALLRKGTLSLRAVERDSEILTADIAVMDRRLADAARTSPTASLLAGTGDLRTRWENLSPAMRGQVIDEVAVVTVLPSPRGLRGFDPDYVDVRFRVDQE
jgi:site-specific DNA recombinase